MSDPTKEGVMTIAKKKLTERVDVVAAKAMKAHAKGLKLVEEHILQPFAGYGFKVDAGQTFRVELIDAPQVFDSIFLVRDRPTKEYADAYHSCTMGALGFYEGMHIFSNTPYFNPVATIIRDTVDIQKLKDKYGDTASHGWTFPSARCTQGIYEAVFGTVNCNSCEYNLHQGIYEIAGREVADSIKTPNTFNFFQPAVWNRRPLNHELMPSYGAFKRGDYVEFLFHQDVYASISMCPVGDQNNMEKGPENWVNSPLRVAIYEGQDGTLEVAPGLNQKSLPAIDFLDQGRPNMVKGKLAEPGSPGWFND